ncbi:MAG TPA: hypothetical protein VM073_02825 [Usitatibacter sp.]|nr:hypothetical protein [Usitatibacter sp.]
MKPLQILALLAAAALAVPANAAGRLAELSVFDRSTGRELPIHWHQGRAYVVGKPGNEYRIDVRNRSGGDLLAIMSVDGVNVLSGKTASATQGGGYVLSSWEKASVLGWRKSMEEIAAFYFTSLGDSYAGRTGRPDNVGVIGVALYERKRPPEPVARADAPSEPARERREGLLSKRLGNAAPEAPASAAAPSAPLGTGHGRREDSPTRFVSFERATEQPAETLTIYYDSYRNLVAQGVLPQYGQRRDPNPFPTGFVPDPR